MDKGRPPSLKYYTHERAHGGSLATFLTPKTLGESVDTFRCWVHLPISL
jgi:hypothetical protein